jgi:hypothetical protein
VIEVNELAFLFGVQTGPDLHDFGRISDINLYGHGVCNLVFKLDKSSWDLVVEELELGQTCPARGPDMSANNL